MIIFCKKQIVRVKEISPFDTNDIVLKGAKNLTDKTDLSIASLLRGDRGLEDWGVG